MEKLDQSTEVSGSRRSPSSMATEVQCGSAALMSRTAQDLGRPVKCDCTIVRLQRLRHFGQRCSKAEIVAAIVAGLSLL